MVVTPLDQIVTHVAQVDEKTRPAARFVDDQVQAVMFPSGTDVPIHDVLEAQRGLDMHLQRRVLAGAGEVSRLAPRELDCTAVDDSPVAPACKDSRQGLGHLEDIRLQTSLNLTKQVQQLIIKPAIERASSDLPASPFHVLPEHRSEPAGFRGPAVQDHRDQQLPKVEVPYTLLNPEPAAEFAQLLLWEHGPKQILDGLGHHLGTSIMEAS